MAFSFPSCNRIVKGQRIRGVGGPGTSIIAPESGGRVSVITTFLHTLREDVVTRWINGECFGQARLCHRPAAGPLFPILQVLWVPSKGRHLQTSGLRCGLRDHQNRVKPSVFCTSTLSLKHANRGSGHLCVQRLSQTLEDRTL